MKKQFFLVLLSIAVMGVVLFSGCTQPVNPPILPGLVSNTGTLLLAIKDKAPDMSLLGSVKLTVSQISIHDSSVNCAEEENCLASWIVLSSEPKEFELLELQDVSALLSEKDLNAGTYNQIMFSIDKVLVDYNGTVQEAKLPSGTLKINVQIVVDANSTSIATLDFDLNKSIHITGNGQIIMLPVIKVVAEKKVRARIEAENRIRIEQHGTTTDDSEIGTDMEGNTGKEIRVRQETELEIGQDGKIKEKQQQGNGTGNGSQDNNQNGQQGTGGQPENGRLVGTIKDKSDKAPLKEGVLDVSQIKSLDLTINSITIHRPNSSDANTSSWIEILSEPKTFNLLELQDSEALLADINVTVGNFTQIRLDINSAIAVVDANTEDENTETYIVKVPSGVLKLTSKIIVDANKTSYFNLDFDLNKSLHATGNDTIIMKPVIKLVSKKGVEVKSMETNRVRIQGGELEGETEMQFNENGESA